MKTLKDLTKVFCEIVTKIIYIAFLFGIKIVLLSSTFKLIHSSTMFREGKKG